MTRVCCRCLEVRCGCTCCSTIACCGCADIASNRCNRCGGSLCCNPAHTETALDPSNAPCGAFSILVSCTNGTTSHTAAISSQLQTQTPGPRYPTHMCGALSGYQYGTCAAHDSLFDAVHDNSIHQTSVNTLCFITMRDGLAHSEAVAELQVAMRPQRAAPRASQAET
jgi:hypothetical protein